VLTATAAGKSRRLNVRFRVTLNGERFVIPHGGQDADAPAAARGDTIVLNGETYGLASKLVFRRVANPDAVCAFAEFGELDRATNAARR